MDLDNALDPLNNLDVDIGRAVVEDKGNATALFITLALPIRLK